VATADEAERHLLDLAEAELAAREAAARETHWTPAELAAFAAEHDALADLRDSLAQVEDEHATQRDAASIDRDRHAADRDRALHPGDEDPGSRGFVDRLLAAGNRDDAAGDRADARDDRRRARGDRDRAAAARRHANDDRETAAEAAALVRQDEGVAGALWQAIQSRQLIGQATGIWMERHDLSADRAFALIAKMAEERNEKLDVIAAQILSTRQWRVVTDPTGAASIPLPSSGEPEPIGHPAEGFA
jgi:hypothetical protein